MQLGRRIVDHLQLDLLILVVVGDLGGGHGVVALIDRQSDEVFGNTADFLGLGFGRLDLAILNQVRHQTAEQRFALTGRATQFALVCHGIISSYHGPAVSADPSANGRQGLPL